MSVMVGQSSDLAGATKNKCGRELARDEATTVNISIDCYAAIASKLAPTGILQTGQPLRLPGLLLINQWSSDWHYHPPRQC
jgi:hypothetical protein